MDLMALADALLLPEDDLSLATVLRSPLFGFDDRRSVRDCLRPRPHARCAPRSRARRRDDPIFAEAAAQLDAARGQAARRETPFCILRAPARRRAARGDASWRGSASKPTTRIDEFLNLALEYERRETPSLQGFLAWLRDARAEVKRDMEIARDEVRVMTVHGAKGLEAPIVILADTMTPPAGPRPPRLLQLADGAMIWAGRKADDVDQVATARGARIAEAEDEYRRLLYVAMTRAADRLIICGAEGLNRPAAKLLVRSRAMSRCSRCWSRKMTAGKRSCAIASRCPAKRPRPRRRRPKRRTPTDTKYRRGSSAGCRRSAAPGIAVALLGVRRRRSAACCAHDARSAAERRNALARGRIVHRLMQSLPDIPRGRPPRCHRTVSQEGCGRFPPRRAGRDRAASPDHPQRFGLCRRVCAGEPGRSADRRPHRARRRRRRSPFPDRWTGWR